MVDDQKIDEKLTLFSEEAENCLIGSALMDNGVIIRVSTESHEFYQRSCGYTWQAIKLLEKKNLPVDLITVTDELEQMEKLTEVGGSAGLAGFVSTTFTPMNAEAYAEIIRDFYKRRKMMAVASRIAINAQDRKSNVDDVASSATEYLMSLSKPLRGAQPIAGFVSKVYDEVEERSKNPQEVWGIPTGFIDIDHYLGGGHEGELWVLAGEPGIGKSKLAMQLAVNMAKTTPGAIYSLEMGGIPVTRRMLSAIGKVETRRLKSGLLEGSDWQLFTEACAQLEGLPIYLSDDPSMTLSELSADLASVQAESGAKWFVVDYMWLIGGADNLEDTDRSAFISRGLRSICRNRNMFGVAIASVTKDQFGSNNPKSKGVRGSGQVIHDADVVAFITKHIPDINQQTKHDLVTLSFTKAREADRGLASIDLLAHSGYPSFADVVTDQFVQEQEPVQQEESWWQK